MANTYTQLYIQVIFAVKYRNAVIEKCWRPQLMAVIGQLINETGCRTAIVNGVEDHVPCFFNLRPSISVSNVVKAAKAKSSNWVNESGLLSSRFEWQRGYGCFSYNKSSVDNVYRYIQNQETRHQKQTFKSEYLDILKKFEVNYQEDYLFEDLV